MNSAVNNNSVTRDRFSAEMFNSPINPLFGIQPAGQDGQRGGQGKEEDKQNKDKDKNSGGNIFSGKEDIELYTDIQSQDFNPETYIHLHFSKLLEEYKNEADKVSKIEKFIDKFDMKKFTHKYGTDLSKEDLNVILYEICEELGL